MTEAAALVPGLLVALYAASAVYAAGHALLNARDPRAAWGWIAACLLAPLAGSLLYLLFGAHRLQKQARRMRQLVAPDLSPVEPEPPGLAPLLPGVIPQERRELVRIGGAMSRRPLEGGNHLRLLHNGEQTYPAMLEAIAAARERVWLSSYIFAGSGIGGDFVDALAAAHARGADVRVLIDGFGDWYYWPRASARLRRRGVPVRRFQLPRRFLPLPHLNLRNHRKLLLIDDGVAFTGGINIGDHHLVQTSRRPVIDLHLRLEGPIAAQLGCVFAEDWIASGGDAPALPTEAAAGDGRSYCRAITEGPNEELDRLELVLLGALANAHRRVCIMTPYFIPMPELQRALEAASLRGVSVEIILPARSNLPWVDWASRRWQRDLIARGVRVFLRPAPFSHAKLFVVDDYYSHMGSANLDPRSLLLNFELVVETYCRDFAGTLVRHFDEVRQTCHPRRLADLDEAPRAARMRDALFWLFSPYL